MITVEQFWYMLEMYESNNCVKKKEEKYIFDTYVQMLNDNNIQTEITHDAIIIVDGSPKMLVTRNVISKLALKAYVDTMKNKKVVLMSVRFNKVASIFDQSHHYTFYTRHYDLLTTNSNIDVVKDTIVKPIEESLENHVNDLL